MEIVRLASSLKFLSVPTAADINLYFTLAFFAILAILVIGFLIGLLRGVWNAGFRLIFIGILAILAFCLTRPIADAIGSMNIPGLLGKFGVGPLNDLSFPISSTVTVVVPVTNLKDMIVSAVSQVYEGLNLGSANSEAAAELITGLAMVFLRYITFIIEAILIMVLGPLLAALFYHCLFKWFIPKRVRKHKKMRLIGAFENMTVVGIVMTMMLIPFSSLLNTINQAFQNPDNATAEGVDSKTYNDIMAYLNAYNQSAFAQVLFNWTVNDQGKTLDVALMDIVSDEQLTDYKLSLTTELYDFAGIGKTILSTGVLDEGLGTTSLQTQLLSNENLVASLFVNVAGSALVTQAIPMAIAIASNMDEVKKYVDPSLLSFDNVDWHEELLNLGTIAKDVVASGVISDVMDAPTNQVAGAVVGSLTDSNKYPDIHGALSSIENSKFLVQVVPAVLYTMVKQDLDNGWTDGDTSLATFLPHDWSDYQDLHIGNELSLFYDVFYDMVTSVDPSLRTTLIDYLNANGTQPQTAVNPRVLGKISNNSNLTDGGIASTKTPQYISGAASIDDIVSIITDNAAAFISLLVGPSDSSGNPTGVDANGKTDLSVTGAKSCLLDSDFLMLGMGSILKYGMKSLSKSLEESSHVAIDEQKITDAVDELEATGDGQRRINYKREYGALLDIVTTAISNPKLAEALGLTSSSSSSSASAAAQLSENGDSASSKITPMRSSSSSIDTSSSSSSENALTDLLGDEEFRDLLKFQICPILDRSVLMNTVFPSVLNSLIHTVDFTDITEMTGLTADSLNFDISDIGTQLSIFVDLAGYASNLTDVLNASADDMPHAIADHRDDVVGLLDSVFESDIINPKTGAFAYDNYYTILESVFGQMSTIGIDTAKINAAIETVPANQWMSARDSQGHITAYGENYYLVNALVTAVDTGLLDLSSSTDIVGDLSSPAYANAISDTFAAVDQSQVMSGCFGSILDDVFSKAGAIDLIDPSGTGTSFTNVTDWTAEGTNLQLLITTMHDFGGDINNIDFINSDPVKVNSLLRELAASQIFDGADGDYLFGNFLFDKLIGTDFKTYLYDQAETESSYTGASAFDIAKSDFDAIGPTTSVADKAAWGDEIDSLTNLIAEINDFKTASGASDAMSALTDGTATAAQLSPIMVAANDCSILHMVIYNVFDTMLGSGALDMGTLNPSEANTPALITMTKAQRAVEIDTTVGVYSQIQALHIDTGFTADKIDKAGFDSLLNGLHDSLIFNTLRADKSRTADDLTIFEQTVRMILTQSTLDTYIYAQYPVYSSMMVSDLIGIGNSVADGTSDGWVGAGKEIERLSDILDAFKQTGLDFSTFGSSGANAISDLMDTPAGTGHVEDLLLSLNHSQLIYPAIPNLFDTMLTSADVSASGINLTTANTHYLGNHGGTPYDDPEISQMIVIYGDMKNMMSTSYADISALNNTTLDNVENLLNDLEQSNVFHLQGAASGVASDPTVFEQMMIKIMDDTGISGQINDTSNPNLAYYNGAVYKFADAHEKATYLVTNYDTHFATGYFTTSWEGTNGEISNFLRIFREMLRVTPSLTTANIDTSALTPSAVSDLLSALNYSDLGSDAVPSLVRDTFGTININNYTGGHEDYYIGTTAYDATELDQKDYTDYPNSAPTTTQTGVLHTLMNGFWDSGTSSYAGMGAAFNLSDYINGGHSTENLLVFLDGSQIVGTTAGSNYETRSLMFYNLLDNVDMSKYIRGTDLASRATKLESIFSTGFHTSMEGDGLDGLIIKLIDLTTATDSNSIQGKGPAVSGMISSTYVATGNTIDDRAYLASELTAGFFTDVLSSDYALAEASTGHGVTVIDFYGTDYAELCPREANGVNGVLEVVPEIDAIVTAPTTAEEVADLQESFNDMGSDTACHTPGPAWNDGNSDIAKLIYASRVTGNANFMAAKGAYELMFAPDTIATDPYSANFIFQTEGAKFCAYFSTLV